MFRNKFSKNPSLILLIILISFLLKGTFLIILFPFLQGPDEQTHYATIQYLSEKPSFCSGSKENLTKTYKDISNDISTYGFSTEIIETAKITRFDEIKWQNYNMPYFIEGSNGEKEENMNARKWPACIEVYPPQVISSSYDFYHKTASIIEKYYQNESILFRFHSVRFLSLLLGTIIVLIVYKTTRLINFSTQQSLLIAAIASFQPMFSQTSAIITYDIMLVFSFSLYIWGIISLLKNSFKWYNLLLISTSITIGIMTKGPALILPILSYPILLYSLYKRLSVPRNLFFQNSFLLSFILFIISFLIIPIEYFKGIFITSSSSFSSLIQSLGKYLNKVVSFDKFFTTEQSYWGNFGWLDTRIPEDIISIIGSIEFIALIGLVIFLFLPLKNNYLPEKKYIIFLIAISITLQIAIRFYDWRAFDAYGKIAIDTPGRYFLPNIIAHFILLATGIGAFFKNESQFELTLKLILVFMAGLSIYSIFDIIIPRYYL